MGPRTGINILENRNISCPCRDSNPGTSSSPSSCRTFPLFRLHSVSICYPHPWSRASLQLTVGIFIACSGSKKHHEISMVSIVDYQVKGTIRRRRRRHKITVRMVHSVDQCTPSNRLYNLFYLRQFSLAQITSSTRRHTKNSLTPNSSMLSQHFIDIGLGAYLFFFGIAGVQCLLGGTGNVRYIRKILIFATRVFSSVNTTTGIQAAH
jgi:hypothetical protein